MSDILLGTIIGGIIGFACSAVVALINGYYSFKSKREDNLIRREELSTRIQHEKNSALISRIIEIRTTYLAPLSDQLGELYTSMDDFRAKLISVIMPYQREKNKIQVEEAKKQEFIQQLETVESALSAINTRQTRIYGATCKVTDMNLRELLNDLIEKLYSLVVTYYKMNVSLLKESTTGHDFIYDFEALLKPVRDISISIGISNRRIESLRAGADAGDE